jgi:AcrR family transcriptional regulator
MDLTPRERRHEKNKQAILQTARELVTEKGADKLSLREIARRIDYSPAALYEYFDGKEDIVGALCTDGFKNLASFLNRVPADLPPSERVVELGLAYLEFANQNPELYILIIMNLPSGMTALDQLDYESSLYSILLQVMQAGIDAGDFTPREGFGLQEMTYSCWAFVHGIATLGLTQLSELEVDLGPVNRLALELFMDAL